MHAVYNNELLSQKRRAVKISYFRKLWQDVMNAGVTDPATGSHLRTEIRRNTCKGFSKCDKCELYQSLARAAKCREKAQAYLQQHKRHLQEVHDDRETLAHIARYVYTHTCYIW